MRLLIYPLSIFTLWMLVDAYRRSAPQFWYPIIIFPFGSVLYFFVVKVDDYEWSRWFLRPGADLKCASCLHCCALYDDCVKCGSGKEPVMKNRVHISYCGDYKAKPT